VFLVLHYFGFSWNVADRENHYTVTFLEKKTIAFSGSAAVHFGVRASSLGYQCIEITSSSEIQTFSFCVVLAMLQTVKSIE